MKRCPCVDIATSIDLLFLGLGTFVFGPAGSPIAKAFGLQSPAVPDEIGAQLVEVGTVLLDLLESRSLQLIKVARGRTCW